MLLRVAQPTSKKNELHYESNYNLLSILILFIPSVPVLHLCQEIVSELGEVKALSDLPKKETASQHMRLGLYVPGDLLMDHSGR